MSEYLCPDPDGCKTFKDVNVLITKLDAECRVSQRLLRGTERQQAEIDTLTANVEDYKEVIKDKRRLTKAISDVLHSDGGGPEQPALCDVLAYVTDDFAAYYRQITALKAALAKICHIRNNSHKHNAIGKCSDMWKTAATALKESEVKK